MTIGDSGDRDRAVASGPRLPARATGRVTGHMTARAAARPAAGRAWPAAARDAEFMMWDEDLEAERRDFARALARAGRRPA